MRELSIGKKLKKYLVHRQVEERRTDDHEKNRVPQKRRRSITEELYVGVLVRNHQRGGKKGKDVPERSTKYWTRWIKLKKGQKVRKSGPTRGNRYPKETRPE